jgi:hypothetical protein
MSAYYTIKPYIPWTVRTALRSLIARATRRRWSPVWPILESAGESPSKWSGWPDGKRFALVLTHDVETSRGLERCQAVAELEKNLGFRSSFNFVPAGSYTTPPELRNFLTRSGFEVGVHDLKHDGKLYRSRKSFRANAEKINNYLRQWDAVGFRSGFMHHNLEWLEDLDISYDTSTFDVDPFEPQPDGVRTIFPFIVKHRANSRDYVELPYTLVQDSTLFFVLKERTIDVWKRKLDWIAERGGMALLNTHPDYMCFTGDPRRDEYLAAYYSEFLRYVETEYRDSYWLALPKEVATYVRQQSTPPELLVGSLPRQAAPLAGVAVGVICDALRTALEVI